ncbi:hypothetical protein ACIP4Y_04745 [Streptomyces sp. NPDC088810]|uniref:hypothetical protein n=1 Tax=Streptomyces sp. NPDC088810 TaxID=3365904 RepID=UPI0037FE7542
MPRDTLTLETIVRTAVELLDEEGRRLGVSATAVYWHVTDKEAPAMPATTTTSSASSRPPGSRPRRPTAPPAQWRAGDDSEERFRETPARAAGLRALLAGLRPEGA